jgi:RNA exonuclease 4
MVEIDSLYNGLARISVVNENGDILVNTYCKPPGKITDYRCEITGLNPSILENALDFSTIRKMVSKK